MEQGKAIDFINDLLKEVELEAKDKARREIDRLDRSLRRQTSDFIDPFTAVVSEDIQRAVESQHIKQARTRLIKKLAKLAIEKGASAESAEFCAQCENPNLKGIHTCRKNPLRIAAEAEKRRLARANEFVNLGLRPAFGSSFKFEVDTND